MKKMEEYIATGRRKTAVASIRLRTGSGRVLVNRRPFEEYFPQQLQRSLILSPLSQCEVSQQFDMIIRVHGGGIEGQATACRLGLSRALVQINEQYRPSLKEVGYLTRDPRKRERKKYGLKGARKRFQFVKR